MKVISKNVDILISNEHEIFHSKDVLFFDIETTGFSPRISQLYLIGVLYPNNSNWIFTQFFATSLSEEEEILAAFCELLKSHSHLICFNGLGFDIPYLAEKCNQFHIEETLSCCRVTDIYRETKHLKRFLGLDHYKQKTLEHFLRIDRLDPFDGQKLIAIYKDYQNNPVSENLQMLLLHNQEDVLNMTNLLEIYRYQAVLEGDLGESTCSLEDYTTYDQKNGSEAVFSFHLSAPVPVPISLHKNGCRLHLKESFGEIFYPLYSGELKYFYSNYKDYYYLPKEDMAVHKSVASYVDKEFRQKAKAENCYSKKKSVFLPQTLECFQPAFRHSRNDRLSYFEVTNDFLDDKKAIQKYLRLLLSTLGN